MDDIDIWYYCNQLFQYSIPSTYGHVTICVVEVTTVI